MSKKQINELPEETTIVDGDLIPFWKTSANKTVHIPFSKFMESVLSQIAENGLVGKVENNYFVFKFDNSGVLQQVEDLGTTYPTE